MDSPTGDIIRKRVCKACDRCRLKKSKCDGSSPCSRCKADNAICVFGERKKSHDKVYPKGYVEMLEQQQGQLVAGLRELYKMLQNGQSWPGSPLQEAQGGHPLTHDILEKLDLLHATGDRASHYDGFEEDCSRMQQRLLEKGASYTRRGSISSESEHGHGSSSSSYGTPPTKSITFNDPFARNNAPPTPPMQSSFPRQSQVNTVKAPQFVPPMRTGLDPAYLMRSSWATEAPVIDDSSNLEYLTQFDSTMYDAPTMSFDQYGLAAAATSPALAVPDWNDTSDLDFSNFINPISS